MNLNKVILIGRITHDIELNKTTKDESVCNFTLATNEKWQDKERTQFHRVSLWGNLAEVVANYCSKGSLLMVEGKIQYRDYKDKQITEIVGNNIQLGPNKLTK